MTSFNEEMLGRVIDVRTELGIRRAVDGTGADVHLVLDSRAVRDAVNGIDVAGIHDYDTAVAEAVKQVVSSDGARFGVPPAEPPAPPAPKQWTQADLDALPQTGEGGRLVNEAIDAGLLRDLGFAPRRKRR